MKNSQQRDQAGRTVGKQRRREAAARGSYGSGPVNKRPTKQMGHASSGKSRKAAREGSKRMQSEGDK